MLIRNAVLVDAEGRRRGDLLLEDGVIREIGEGLDAPDGCEVIDAKGCTVMPSFVDLHAHFRTPGFE